MTQRWCETNNLPDGSVVTERKILRFLEDKLESPEDSDNSSKRRRTDEAGEAVTTMMDNSRLDLYISALITLWSLQCSTGLSGTHYPQPRREHLRSEIREMYTREQERRKAEAALREVRERPLQNGSGDVAAALQLRRAYPQMSIQDSVVRTIEASLQGQSKRLENAIRAVVDVSGRHFEVTVRELPLEANPTSARGNGETVRQVEGEGEQAADREEPVVVAPPPENAATSSQAQPSTLSEPPVLDRNAPPPLYTMDRTLHRVADLWDEWEHGRFGNPPIRALEEVYGASWRPEQKERVFFGRRKRIIEEVERLAYSYGAMTESNCQRAVEALDERCSQGGYSLDRLYKILREEARQAGR